MTGFRRRLALLLCLCLLRGAAASIAASPAFVSPAVGDVVASPSHHGGVHLATSRHRIAPRPTLLAATSDDNASAGTTSKSARERGIYARPSAAIEKGSGFFIPGLEGSRIRFLFGIAVLLIDAASHVLGGSQPGDGGQAVAESLAAFYGALLLLQGSIEVGVERGLARGGGIEEGTGEIGGSVPNRGVGISSEVSDALKGNAAAVGALQRMAQTIINFTPATYFLFVDEDAGVLFSYGVGTSRAMAMNAEEQKQLARLSLDAVSGSRGGRVALPSEHPASKLLPDAATRCILVQKADEASGSRACMIIGSDKLLPSFTKNDLRWIGQLADYNKLIA